MGHFSKFFLKLKEGVLGKAESKPDVKSIKLPSHEPREITPSQVKPGEKHIVHPPLKPPKKAPKVLDTTSSDRQKRDPYFIQIGFDFGTSYSKCVCRDIMANKAWVHLYSKSQDQELPFLIPSALIIKNNHIFHVKDTRIHYPENGLYHLKNALVLAANGNLENPLLDPYRYAVRLKNKNQLPALVVSCAIYFLAGALGDIREQFKKRFPDFGIHPDDYLAINLAIPVEDAQQPKLNRLYHKIISEAYELANKLPGHPHIHLKELIALRKKIKSDVSDTVKDACFIYPEVSASVQGFVRSRVSSPGIYLFSDTGGGTVDQSIFIFSRREHKEHLTYLAGRVLPFGSSQIERRAAEKCGKTDCLSLENWRERKESGEEYPELKEAQNWIYDELVRGTECTIALAKRKLFVKKQLNDIKVIFGGGGHCEYPYKTAVMKPFSGQLFREALDPDVIGMPVPSDLELKSDETRWMRRLNVAYGLSFEKSELSRFTYPKDVSTPAPEEIWQPQKSTVHAPSKDEC